MQKKSLILTDGDKLKVVYGDKIRCINFADLSLEHNAQFLEKIFRTTTVYRVDKVAAVSREELGLIVEDTKTETKAKPDAKPPKTLAESPPVTQRTTSTDRSSNWIKSNSRTTIIVDDLLTGSTIGRGGATVPQSLVLHPGKPFDLGTIDDGLVKASRILPRLLSNGTVSRISFDEAMGMLDSYNSSQEQVISVLDEQAKSVVAPKDVRAADLVDSMFSMEDAIPIEIGEKDLKGDPNSNEDSGSMQSLMAVLSEAEANGELEGKRPVKYAGTVKKAGR